MNCDRVRVLVLLARAIGMANTYARRARHTSINQSIFQVRQLSHQNNHQTLRQMANPAVKTMGSAATHPRCSKMTGRFCMKTDDCAGTPTPNQGCNGDYTVQCCA
jgi:hypothetical protein